MMPTITLAGVVAVSIGAALGALARWFAGLWLNAAYPSIPMGTLLVNCVGGLLIGACLEYFLRLPNETLRLLCVTGFLGGLTTFSSYSVESLILLQRGDFGLALLHTTAHVLGALTCAFIGNRVAAAWFAPS